MPKLFIIILYYYHDKHPFYTVKVTEQSSFSRQSNRNKGFPFPDSDDQSHSIVTDVVNFVSEVSQVRTII